MYDFTRQYYETHNAPSTIMAGTFALWNVLNAIARNHEPKYRYQQGHIRPVQATAMVESLIGKESYCEIGFNAGHSAALALNVDPKIKVHSFDLMMFNYSWPAATILNASFGNRLNIYPGSSVNHIIAHVQTKDEVRCNICGWVTFASHRQEDLMQSRCMADSNTIFFIDDIHTGSGVALKNMKSRGIYDTVRTYGPYPPRHALNPCMQTPTRRDVFPMGVRDSKTDRFAQFLDLCISMTRV